MQFSGQSTHIKTTAVWLDNMPASDLPDQALPAQADVVVIGGGFTGLSAARILAQQGIDVTLLEAKTIGWGASTRNGGIATPGNRQSMQVIIKQYGDKLAHEIWNASLDAIDMLGEVVADEQISCHFSRKGHILLAAKPSHFSMLRKKADWYQHRLNYNLRVISPGELHSEIGSPVFHGGLVDEWSAGLDPAQFVFGMAQAVQTYGGTLCENTAVTDIQKQKKKFLVHTTKGTIMGRQVLLATNGYSDDLLPDLQTRLVPTGSYVIATEPLPPKLLDKLNPHGRLFHDSLRQPHYFRMTSDGRVLFGGYPELTPTMNLIQSSEKLYGRLTQIFPDLKGVPITHSWSGKIGSSTDLMPHIGQLEGIYYALGYSGHGVALATYLGAEIAKLLTNQIERSPFMEIGHPNRCFYKRYRSYWMLKAKYDRLMDRLT